MTNNDLCKILCFTPLEIRIELRNVSGKLTFYCKFLNNWDIRRRKIMTRKIFIDKTKEFKKPSINTNQYDFFCHPPPLPLSPSCPSLQNSGAINRMSLENKSPQVKIFTNKNIAYLPTSLRDLAKLWGRCNFLLCHANTSREKLTYPLMHCFRSYLMKYFPCTFLLIVSTIGGLVCFLSNKAFLQQV